MLTITYGFIFLLITGFEGLHSDTERLAWIERQ
jgi:hypothetical protein